MLSISLIQKVSLFQWGHHVRGEVVVAGARQLPEAFVELEAEMGDLGAKCERSGVAQEFRQFKDCMSLLR